ncbi:MAG TPA: hypothetical protein DGA22_08920 [Acidobacterium sp.]|nr:hypothetical protein [Acidobacterium sp.]
MHGAFLYGLEINFCRGAGGGVRRDAGVCRRRGRVRLARACFDLVHKTNHCLGHALAHCLEVKAVLAVAGGLPGFDGLGGFALGLLLRNEVATQQRQQSL